MSPNNHTSTTNANGIRYNTSYYRRNKKQRFCVHKCPQCLYETTGPKQSIQAHIWAKHTQEQDKPFQCPCDTCERGFAAKANLYKHILKVHKITMPKHRKNIIAFEIINQPLIHEKKYLNKLRCYSDIKILSVNDLPPTLTLDVIYFDWKSKLIDIKIHTRQELLKRYYST